MQPPPTFIPGVPIAPPIKKQKSADNSGGDTISSEADRMISDRRQELQRLRQQQAGPSPVFEQARNALSFPPVSASFVPQPRGVPQPPAPIAQQPPLIAPPSRPPMPPAQANGFLPSNIRPKVSATTVPTPQGPPPPSSASVARRLEVSFASDPAKQGTPPDKSRSTSAPPVRPPPPRPPPPRLVEETKPKRDFVGRPAPVVPGAPPVPAIPPPGKLPPKGPPPTAPPRPPVPPLRNEALSPEATTSTSRGKFEVNATPVSETPEETKEPSSAGRTPFPSISIDLSGADDTPPTSNSSNHKASRAEVLRNMRAVADTPPGKPKPPGPAPPTPATMAGAESLELRMKREMVRLEKDKKEALNQVKILQEEMTQLRNHADPQVSALLTIIDMADREGPAVALRWARDQFSSMKQVGFMSPLATLMQSPGGPPVSPLAGMGYQLGGSRKRIVTPHPKRILSTHENGKDDRDFLMQAVESVPFEYISNLATFTIRRPFGMATERDLWFSAGQLPAKQYEKQALITKPSSLEVVAKIEADNSLLVLFGDSNVKHQSAADGGWKDYDNVDDRTAPLGYVLYIDTDAIEKEYLLDNIFEGAAAVREHYCSSILSTSAALRLRHESASAAINSSYPYDGVPNGPTIGMDHIPKSESLDACVGTEDLVNDPPQPPTDRTQEVVQGVAAPSPEETSADVLGTFITMFFSTIFGMVWFIFVKVPLKIISFTLLTAVAVVILSVVWLYLADDHGASAMGARMTMYNRPGIV